MIRLFKIIIVEDDEIMCEGIKKNIPWLENGIEVVDTAANGIEGLRLVELHKPQIVLTDITMPFMNGLQMADQIMKSFPWIKIVFLTGYDDFKYAKKALDLKASEYLLKYEDNDAILEAVKKACREFDRERNLFDRIEKSKPLMKDKFFSELITCVDSGELVEKEVRLLEIDFVSSFFCVTVIHIIDWEKRFREDKQQCMEWLYSIRNICEETMKESECLTYCVGYYNQICILFNPKADSIPSKEYMARTLGKLMEDIKKCLSAEIAMGIGDVYEGYANISRSYSDAVIALEMRDILRHDGIIFSSEVKNNENSHSVIMKRIIEYVNGNYLKEELSLGDIANEVYISPAYISTLFKKYMGINYSEYLAQIRIKKAEELFEQTHLKTYEVAEKVGYTNPQYFSTLFKKLTGYSPTDYKLRKKEKQPTIDNF